jgi:predicted metal-dependent HD superfamily phosphohydrolase
MTDIAHDSTDDAAIVASMLSWVPVADTAKTNLLNLLMGPDRHYHGLEHLAALWRRHCALSPGTGMDAPDLQPQVAAVIGWHDAIYVAGRSDNEAASAKLWQDAAAGGGLRQEEIDWVATTIAATADHIGPRMGIQASSPPVQWLLDLDLSPLGEDPTEFARKTAKLACEYAPADAQNWTKWRLEFFRRLTACPKIFLSPVISAAYEIQARCNVEQELARAREDDSQTQAVSIR